MNGAYTEYDENPLKALAHDKVEVSGKYTKYDPDALKALVHEKVTGGGKRPIGKKTGDAVYETLFAGLDFVVLELMCVQITQIRQSRPQCMSDPVVSAVSRYADQIIALVAAWKKITGEIVMLGEFFAAKSAEARRADEQDDEPGVRTAFTELKGRLEGFKSKAETDMKEVTDKGNVLSNFILGDLKSAVADKARWTDTLAQCLSNDAFIEGTETSMYNAKTLFAFVFSNISQSIDIIKDEDALSSISVLFTLDGQVNVWACTTAVTKRLLKNINDFDYEPSPITPF